MYPARQRFEASDPPALEGDNWLITDFQCIIVEGSAQIAFKRPATFDRSIHLGLVEGKAVAAAGFAAIQCQVGILHQLVRLRAVARGKRDANAGADFEAMALDAVGVADGLDDAARQGFGLVGVAGAGLNNGEFVAAEARHQVAPTHAA
jgi:hypothetical protein